MRTTATFLLLAAVVGSAAPALAQATAPAGSVPEDAFAVSLREQPPVGLSMEPALRAVWEGFARDNATVLRARKAAVAPPGGPRRGFDLDFETGATAALARDLLARQQVDPSELEPFCCSRKYFWLAASELVLVQVIPWYFNRHVADDETAVLGIESWLRNLREGFEWDPNDFKTNMFMHPFHGSLYFNAARSNGYNYWESAAFAWAGSFIWEMFGENNRGAINDWAATSFGGIALGEALHRAATAIRDNTATGAARGGQEIAGFVIDPMGGFNRLVRGEMSRVGPNPEGRLPEVSNTLLRLGVRGVSDVIEGEGRSGSGGVFEFEYRYGDPYTETAKPFDNFELRLQVNGRDTETLGRLQVEGMMLARSLGGTREDGAPRTMFKLMQHYDYVNNAIFETGGQSLSATFLLRRKLSDSWSFRTRVQPTVALLWAVSSDIPQRAEGRSYDFGSGGGLRTRLFFSRKGRDWLEIFYLGMWSHTLSGAEGSHLIQFLGARAQIPIFRRLGIGADFTAAVRRSNYRDHPDVRQDAEGFKLYLILF